MEAKDLRIGNFVVFGTNPDKILEVSSTVIEDCSKAELSEAPYRYEPIPITEEWLLRFGFKKDGFNALNKSIAWYPKQEKVLCFSGDYLFMKEGDNDDICTLWNKDIYREFYVHQLQNLYHALTGEELTIHEATTHP